MSERQITIDWSGDSWLEELATALRLDIHNEATWLMMLTTGLLNEATKGKRRNADVNWDLLTRAGRRCIDWLRSDVTTGLTENEKEISDFVADHLDGMIKEVEEDR